MYCNKCGTELKGVETYCSNCGNKVKEDPTVLVKDESTENCRVASIILGGLSLGGIFFLILAPISLILGIVGLILALKANKNSKNVAGIVMNSIGIFISFIMTLVLAFILFFAIDVINKGVDYYDDNIEEYVEEQWYGEDNNNF